MQAKPRDGDARSTSRRRCPATSRTSPQVAKTGQSQLRPLQVLPERARHPGGRDGGEYKYFAPGVGGIRTEPRYEGGEQEVEELINFTQLSPRALAELSAEALKLDKHARTTAKDVFGSSSPAKRTL